MKVLFVTNSSRLERPYLDPAVRYRCYNPAFDLRRLGHLADVAHVREFSLDWVDYYDVFVFHKPPLQRLLEAAVALIEKRGKIAVADYDDLIFNEKHALSSSLFLTGRASKKIVRDIFRRNHEALKVFHYVTVSTTSLGEQVADSNRDAVVQVVHNGLNEAWVSSSASRFGGRPVPGMISYFCGTKSHDHDFGLIKESLAILLREEPKVTLRVVGPLDFPADAFPRKQLQLLPAVAYEDLSRLIMQSWINIAPLQDNLFNRCKSGLKYFEAAVFGVPTVASPIPDMARFADSGLRLASAPEEWSGRLLELLDSGEHDRTARLDRAYARDKCVSMLQTRCALEFYEARRAGAPVDGAAGVLKMVA